MGHHFHSGKYFLLGLIILCGVIFVDQYTKWLVIETVLRTKPLSAGFLDWFITLKKIAFFVNEREHFRTILLLPVLNVVMVWNQGISFGILESNSPRMALVFIALSLALSLAMFIWLAINTQKVVAIALGLIIGGALGNVMDRVRFNAVADFIDFHYQEYHYPAFNVADSCIVIGAGILMLSSLLIKEGTKRKK